MPLWVPLAIFAAFFSFVYVIFLFASLTGRAAPPLDSHLVQLIPAVATGLFGAGITWFSGGYFRYVTVSGSTLSISLGFGSTPLTAIEAVSIVRGDELKHLRKNLSDALEPKMFPGLLVVPEVAAALAAYRNIPRSRAALSPPWMHEAVIVYAPETETPLRLIGTRHPEELKNAIERGKITPVGAVSPAGPEAKSDLVRLTKGLFWAFLVITVLLGGICIHAYTQIGKDEIAISRVKVISTYVAHGANGGAVDHVVVESQGKEENLLFDHGTSAAKAFQKGQLVSLARTADDKTPMWLKTEAGKTYNTMDNPRSEALVFLFLSVFFAICTVGAFVLLLKTTRHFASISSRTI